MTGVIQFALGGSVELESQSRRGFPTRAEWLFFGVDSDFALVPVGCESRCISEQPPHVMRRLR